MVFATFASESIVLEFNLLTFFDPPAPESINGGPPSYICRLSGSSKDNWAFWLEVILKMLYLRQYGCSHVILNLKTFNLPCLSDP